MACFEKMTFLARGARYHKKPPTRAANQIASRDSQNNSIRAQIKNKGEYFWARVEPLLDCLHFILIT